MQNAIPEWRRTAPHYPLCVVPAVQEPLHGLRDALLTARTQSSGELRVVSTEELEKMGTEDPLQRARAPRAAGARGCRIQGQRQLVCHA